jgi:hypothetical protein
VGAVALGNVAASHTASPKTWVSVLSVIAGALLLAYIARSVHHPPDPQKTADNIERMHKVALAPAPTIVAAGALLANAGVFMVIALKDISQLDPSTSQYIIDWVLFAVASMLPLGLALVLLRVAPGWTMPALTAARGFIERYARTIAFVILVALAASLLREGISGLTG